MIPPLPHASSGVGLDSDQPQPDVPHAQYARVKAHLYSRIETLQARIARLESDEAIAGLNRAIDAMEERGVERELQWSAMRDQLVDVWDMLDGERHLSLLRERVAHTLRGVGNPV